MKKIITLLFLMLKVIELSAQVPNRGCGTIIPSSQYDSLFQSKVIDFLNTNSAFARVQTTYQIPVIIHVIHNGQAIGTFPNLAQGQINSQISVLNDDYAGIGFNSGNYLPTAFLVYATNTVIAAASKDGLGRIGISNTGITFCLALKDSVGNVLPEPGIERMHWNTISGASNPTTYTTTSAFMTFMNNTVMPATIWNPAKYLNIWISDVNASAGILGFTAFPPLSGLIGITGGATATTDGLWCWAKTFGSQNIYSIGTYDPVYKYGRTTTHELSHYFGVRHTWGDGNCLTDYCNDVPSAQGPTYGTAIYPYLPNNCASTVPPTGTEGIMFMNFADYTDDAAMYMFTDEQKARMQTAMLNSPYRKLLGTHGLCSTGAATVVANFSISPAVIFQGQSVSITDLSTTTSPPIISWNYFSAASTITTSTLQNPSFTFNTPGVYTISLTISSAGTNASTTKTLQVNACPIPTVNVNTINASCAGSCNGSATMISNGGSPFTYSWTPSVSSSSVASGLCNGTYTCVITNSCGVSVTKIFNITSPPPLIVNINVAGAPVCQGNSVNLTSAINGGSPSYLYSWSTGSNLSSITVTPTIMPVTIYSLTVTDSQGCTAVKSVSITVNPIPSITVTPANQTICSGKTATVSLSGAQNYTTNPGAITLSTFTVSPTSTTVYTVTGTTPFGCVGTKRDTIKVTAPPTIFSYVSSNTVCLGSVITFSNSGGSSYTLSPSSLTGNLINIAPSSLGTTIFTVSGTGPFGCISTKTVGISTFSLPVVTISPSNTTICSGKSVLLTASGASSYTWAGSGIVSNSISVSPTANTIYSVIGRSTNGCENSASSSVSVLPQPIVSINSPSTNVCFGYTMTVAASGANNYQWSTGATTNTILIQPFSASVYSVIGKNGGMCSDTAFLSITVLPLPSVSSSVSQTLACVGQTVGLYATGNAVQYYWQPNTLIGPTHTVQVVAPTTYTVYGQGSNGCYFFCTSFVDVQAGNAVMPVATPSAVCLGDSAVLSVVGGYVPAWNNNPVPNTLIVSPLVQTSYTISATDLAGCVSDVVFNVGINANCDMIIYNGFTPNGDGINDFLTIDNIEKFPQNKVFIYNRWGNKVFSTSGYNNLSNNWDGKLDGKLVTTGTYFYIVVDHSEKLLKKGWIELTN